MLISSLTACSSTQPTKPHISEKHNERYQVSAIDLNAVKPLALFSNKLAQHRVVFVGEIHTSYADHLNQLAVIKHLKPRWGSKLSIGLEMIQQPYQSFLDQYIAGKINEEEMLRGVQWYDRWKYDFRLYRPIFDYAKLNRIPLVALNISKELTNNISKNGINGLSKTEREQLPKIIDRTNPAYIKRIKKVFGSHAHTRSKSFDNFLDAQLGWDEGIAFNAAKYLKANTHTNMVILAGEGHVIFHQGIPNRLDRQLKIKSAVVLNNVPLSDKLGAGDYLLFSSNKKLPTLPKFGIRMADAKGKGIHVTKIIMHSAAQKAGVIKGDFITKLNDKKIKDILDLKLFMEKRKAGDELVITVKRKQQLLILKTRLKTVLASIHNL